MSTLVERSGRPNPEFVNLFLTTTPCTQLVHTETSIRKHPTPMQFVQCSTIVSITESSTRDANRPPFRTQSRVEDAIFEWVVEFPSEKRMKKKKKRNKRNKVHARRLYYVCLALFPPIDREVGEHRKTPKTIYYSGI